MGSNATHDAPYAVELRGLAKAFGTCVANSDVSLRARRGTIHAIVGENGAGKSTAMKMLYGMYRPDEGEILIDGVRREWGSPRDAVAAGVGMVHQHFMLAGPYTALDNVMLAAETGSAFRKLDRASARGKLEELSRAYGLQVPWDKLVEELPVGVQQRIEILKLLYLDAKILILDEPTAVLTPQETQELFVQLKELARSGKTILIITHKLKEVMSLSDDVTVLRAGRMIGSRETRATSIEELASLMVGRRVNVSLGGQLPRKASRPDPSVNPVLETRNLKLAQALKGVSLEVRAGEIVGIAGVEGNGQSELLHALVRPSDWVKSANGSIRILGTETLKGVDGGGKALATRKLKDLGVGVIPEDRHREGLLLSRSVLDNFLLGLQRTGEFIAGGMGITRWSRARAVASHALEAYDIRPRRLDIALGNMSGGNQQKVIIAREFHRDPRVLIAAQPTRGVDVGAIEAIHQRMIDARDRGAGILLVSSELDEILALADRILVMYHGQIVASLDRAQADEEKLGLYMGGAQPEAEVVV